MISRERSEAAAPGAGGAGGTATFNERRAAGRTMASWLGGTVGSERLFGGRRPALAAVLLFGVPVAAYYGAVVMRAGVSAGFLAGYLATAVWSAGYPFLLWRFESKHLPEFLQNAPSLVENPDALLGLDARLRRAFTRWGWGLSAVFALLAVVIYWRALPNLVADGGIGGRADPLFLIGLLVAALSGLLVGFGAAAALVTVDAVRSVCALRLRIDPQHPDGIAGLKPFGKLILPVTLTVAAGSLAMPLVVRLAPSDIDPFVLLGFASLTVSIVLCFAYPTLHVHARAKDAREARLARLNSEYDALRARLTEAHVSVRETKLRMDVVRREQAEERATRLYPFEVGALVELVSSVLIPTLVLVVTLVVQRYGFGS